MQNLLFYISFPIQAVLGEKVVCGGGGVRAKGETSKAEGIGRQVMGRNKCHLHVSPVASGLLWLHWNRGYCGESSPIAQQF